jgi:hypothetical protein
MKELGYLVVITVISFAFYHIVRGLTILGEKLVDKFKKKIEITN